MEYKKESGKFSVGLGMPSENSSKEFIVSILSVIAAVTMFMLKIKLKRKKKIFPKHFTK